MTEDKKTKFTDEVILIDATHLDFIAGDMRHHFAKSIGRTIDKLDMANFVICLALDAWGVNHDVNKMVLMVYDKKSCALQNCLPGNISAEMDGKAFSCEYGEFRFAGVPAEGMVSVDDLFLDLLTIVADSYTAKRIAIVGNEESYGRRIEKIVADAKGKSATRFVMRGAAECDGESFATLAYPLLSALGIREDELRNR